MRNFCFLYICEFRTVLALALKIVLYHLKATQPAGLSNVCLNLFYLCGTLSTGICGLTHIGVSTITCLLVIPYRYMWKCGMKKTNIIFCHADDLLTC